MNETPKHSIKDIHQIKTTWSNVFEKCNQLKESESSSNNTDLGLICKHEIYAIFACMNERSVYLEFGHSDLFCKQLNNISVTWAQTSKRWWNQKRYYIPRI